MRQSIWLSKVLSLCFHWRMNIPRSGFLRSIRALLEGMLERVWNLEREMVGWGRGERLDLLFDGGHSDNGLDSENQ